MKPLTRRPGIFLNNSFAQGSLVLTALFLVAWLTPLPASASQNMHPAEPTDAQTILLCLKDLLLVEHQPFYDWITVTFPENAPRNIEPVRPDSVDPMVAENDFDGGRVAATTRMNSPRPCQKRSSAEYAAWSSAPIHDPKNMRDQDSPNARYSFDDCQLSWPVRRGSAIVVKWMCIGKTHLPEGTEDGHPCGGMFMGESSILVSRFQRTGKIWTYRGTFENGNVEWATKGVRCKAPPTL